MKKTLIIAKREYIKVIRKPAFWLATLFFPIFIVAVSLISGLSAANAEEAFEKGSLNAKEILVIDKSNYIKKDVIKEPFKLFNNESEAIELVKQSKVDAAIIYDESLEKTKQIKIYAVDKGLFFQSRFNQDAVNLLKEGILNELNDKQKIDAYKADYNINVTSYNEGEKVTVGFESLILPGTFLILYFVLTMFASSYLLLSVSEEKENRVMEILLSSVKPKELIGGKIIGLLCIIITQIIILTILSLIGLIFVGLILLSQVNPSSLTSSANPTNIPAFNLTNLNINPIQILLGVVYTILGFFIMACAMVGVGAAMPTYREAQNFSVPFVLLSILPMYFITIILTEPNGTVAKIFSYFPFSASFVLLFRNGLGVLSTGEIVLSIVVLLIYSYLFFVLAFKLFEFGSLEYGKRISFKDFVSSFKR